MQNVCGEPNGVALILPAWRPWSQNGKQKDREELANEVFSGLRPHGGARLR